MSLDTKLVKSEMVVDLVTATLKRVELLKRINASFDYHWKVEGKNMLEEWDAFHREISPILINIQGPGTIPIKISLFNRLAYFMYFFGSFYKHNGEKSDETYVMGCYIFLSETIGFVDGDEKFNMEEFFYTAFPKK